MFSRYKYGDNCLACRIPYVAVPVRSQHFSSVYSPFQRLECRFCGLECKFCPMECKFQPVELKTYRPNVTHYSSNIQSVYGRYPCIIRCVLFIPGVIFISGRQQGFLYVSVYPMTLLILLFQPDSQKNINSFFSNNSALQKDLTTKKHKITLRDA